MTKLQSIIQSLNFVANKEELDARDKTKQKFVNYLLRAWLGISLGLLVLAILGDIKPLWLALLLLSFCSSILFNLGVSLNKKSDAIAQKQKHNYFFNKEHFAELKQEIMTTPYLVGVHNISSVETRFNMCEESIRKNDQKTFNHHFVYLLRLVDQISTFDKKVEEEQIKKIEALKASVQKLDEKSNEKNQFNILAEDKYTSTNHVQRFQYSK